MLTTLDFSFRRDGADLPLNQYDKDKKFIVGNLNRSIKFCNQFIVITEGGCFIFLTNITLVDKEIKYVIQLMSLENN